MAEMGRRSSPEKTNFAVACSLLSQYIKEKGSAADLGLGMASPPAEPAKVTPEAIWLPTTMSLLPGAYVPGKGTATECRDASLHGNVMELFPQQSGFGPSPATTAAIKTPETRMQERRQLTIFYGGKVVVFDDFPSDKAKDLMQTLGGYMPQTSTAEATVLGHANGLPNQDSKLTPATIDDTPVVAAAQSHLQKSSISALPQRPKASLKRFLQERKLRINAVSPYQVTKPLDDPLKSDESKSWLGLAPQDSTPRYSINSDCSFLT